MRYSRNGFLPAVAGKFYLAVDVYPGICERKSGGRGKIIFGVAEVLACEKSREITARRKSEYRIIFGIHVEFVGIFGYVFYGAREVFYRRVGGRILAVAITQYESGISRFVESRRAGEPDLINIAFVIAASGKNYRVVRGFAAVAGEIIKLYDGKIGVCGDLVFGINIVAFGNAARFQFLVARFAELRVAGSLILPDHVQEVFEGEEKSAQNVRQREQKNYAYERFDNGTFAGLGFHPTPPSK